jgi:hypothetical protein
MSIAPSHDDVPAQRRPRIRPGRAESRSSAGEPGAACGSATAFQSQLLMLPLDKLLTVNRPVVQAKRSRGYIRILASLREVGLVEPLVVYPHRPDAGEYLLLDGRARRLAMMELGWQEALCLVATEDEAYTYNHKVCRLTPIQEHFMIVKAIAAGVPEARLAAALGTEVAHLRRKQSLLTGVCPEVVAMVRDKGISHAVLRELKRVKPMRQIEIVELMQSSRDCSESFVAYLVAASAPEQLVASTAANCEDKRGGGGGRRSDADRMERELEAQRPSVEAAEAAYARDSVLLTRAVAYIRQLVGNAALADVLARRHPSVWNQFQALLTASGITDSIPNDPGPAAPAFPVPAQDGDLRDRVDASTIGVRNEPGIGAQG